MLGGHASTVPHPHSIIHDTRLGREVLLAWSGGWRRRCIGRLLAALSRAHLDRCIAFLGIRLLLRVRSLRRRRRTVDQGVRVDQGVHVVRARIEFPRWLRTAENRDVRTGPFTHPLARSHTPLTPELAPHCSLVSE